MPIKTIDEKLYAQLVAKGHGKAASYRKAGYIQRGKVDNAKMLANQLEKRPDVQTLLKQYREEQYGDLKDVTKARLQEMLTGGWDGLDKDQKIKFLGQACKITGVSAPNTLNINQNTQITQTVTIDEAIKGLMSDDRFKIDFAGAIEAEVIEGPEEEGDVSSALPSDSE